MAVIAHWPDKTISHESFSILSASTLKLIPVRRTTVNEMAEWPRSEKVQARRSRHSLGRFLLSAVASNDTECEVRI